MSSLDRFGQIEITPNKKEAIYTKILAKLKNKISQILLYDKETAMIFIQEYNNILQDEEKLGIYIIEKAGDLEQKIQIYEEERGKQKLYGEQSKTIAQQIEHLYEECEKLNIKDFESKFLEIKDIYNANSQNYSYTDRDVIEKNMASIQAKLIMRKARKGVIDLYSDISKEDEERLNVVINNTINTYMQSQDPNVQKVINEIKYKMINRTDAIYDPEIWRLLDRIQVNEKEMQEKETQEEYNQELIPTDNSSNPLFPSILKKFRKVKLPSFKSTTEKQKTIKIGNLKMIVNTTVKIGDKTIKTKDLSEIDMEWLASQMPQDMLTEIEEERLRKEGRKTSKLREKYIPDTRTPIYDFVLNKYSIINRFDFYNENGTKLNVKEKAHDSFKIRIKSQDGTKQEQKFFSYNLLVKHSKIIHYAKLIDRITTSNLYQQLLNEIGVFFEKQILCDNKGKNYHSYEKKYEMALKQLPILNNLSKSLSNLEKRVNETKFDFNSKEETKREEFYNKQKFRSNLIERVDERKIRNNDNLENLEESVEKMIKRLEEKYY